MTNRFNHVSKVTAIFLEDWETEKLRKWFESQLKMEWPSDVDDNAAVGDAIREIIEDE